MAQLQFYRGDAGLGLGANASIPAIPTDTNLNQITSTARDIMLLDNQRNTMLFQQKVRDRDDLTKMIMDGQVQTGNILPEYQGHFDAAKKEVEKAFLDWKGNFNDIPGYLRYQQANTRLRDVATHAQSNTAEIGKLRTQIAGTSLPRKKEEMQKFLDEQMNQNFWEPIKPYQQFHDFAMADILKVPPDKTKIVYDPNDPAKSYTQTYTDYDDILRFKKDQAFNAEEDADSIAQFSKKYRGYNQPQMKTDLEALDAQIDKYNKAREFTVGQSGYVPHIQRENINGQIVVTEPDVEFAAKYALAHKDQFASSQLNFNKDLAKNEIDKEKLKLQAKKFGLDAAKTNAYVKYMGALTKKAQQSQIPQASSTDVQKQIFDFIDNLKITGLNIGQQVITKDKNGNVTKTEHIPGTQSGTMGAVFVDDLPENYRNIGGPIVNDKGKVTVGTLTPFISTDPSHRPYYIPKIVDTQTGEEYKHDSEFLTGKFKAARRAGFKGDMEDMIKVLLKLPDPKTGKVPIELVMKGKNGSANYSTIFQSAKTVNAIGTSKGEENIVNPPPTSGDSIINSDQSDQE